MAHEAIETMLRQQVAALAICRSQTQVEYESDPKLEGRTAIKIVAPDRASVQFQMDKLFALVDRDGGFANFVGPHRAGSGWRALGEVVVNIAEQHD